MCSKRKIQFFKVMVFKRCHGFLLFQCLVIVPAEMEQAVHKNPVKFSYLRRIKFFALFGNTRCATKKVPSMLLFVDSLS